MVSLIGSSSIKMPGGNRGCRLSIRRSSVLWYIDFPFNLTGVLYFPKLSQQLEVQKNKIQLYSNQVYVTDDVKDIVPEFFDIREGDVFKTLASIEKLKSKLQVKEFISFEEGLKRTIDWFKKKESIN